MPGDTTESREPAAAIPHLLVDAPEDGMCEEWGWVLKSAAETPEQAVRLLAERYPLPLGDNLAYRCDGRSEHLHMTSGQLGDESWWEVCPPETDGAHEFWRVEVVTVAEGMASTNPPLRPKPKTDIWFVGEEHGSVVTLEDEFPDVVRALVKAWADRDDWPMFSQHDRGPIAVNPKKVEAVKIHEPVNF